MKYLLEAIAYDIESCRQAQDNRADRIELCDNPAEGGTTPSVGFIQQARKMLHVDLYCMIRARGGDFVYTDDELEIMLTDINAAKGVGCDGVVFGSLNANGTINEEHLQKIIKAASPLPVTFHRAFDRVAEPIASIKILIDHGVTRVLTSGLQKTAWEGRDLIRQLIHEYGSQIIIMPGAGVRARNIATIIQYTGVREIHTSASGQKYSGMELQNALFPGDHSRISLDSEELKACREQLDHLCALND